MAKLTDAFPILADLEAASPEQIGRALLGLISPSGMFSGLGVVKTAAESYGHNQTAAAVVVQEGWMWLSNKGLVIRDPWETGGGYFLLARKAKELQREGNFEAYVLTEMLSENLLHPLIVAECLSDFRQRHFSKAVQRCMTAVEDRVRKAGAIPPSVPGSVTPMRQAFGIESGSLTDMNAEKGERVGVMELFAGAMGYYRDGHTLGDVNEPKEAAQILVFASNLLAIVDDRSK